MSQQSIDFYLRQRKETIKRKASTEDINNVSSKVFIVDTNEFISDIKGSITPNDATSTYSSIKLISNKKESLADKKCNVKGIKAKGKAVIKLSFDSESVNPFSNGHVSVSDKSSHIESRNPDGGISTKSVKFTKRGALSPKKKNKNADITSYLTKPNESKVVSSEENSLKSNTAERGRKELSLGDIKKCLTRSSRINQLRSSISRLNKGFDQLNELNKITNTSSDASSLKGFKSIDLLIPVSPSKQSQSPCKIVPQCPLSSPMKIVEPLMSPRKVTSASPIKSPLKVPAYERYASLAAPTPTLHLPHHYRWLGEVFKALEQVSSMLYNRKETITFSKVKHAVQEILRRNLTEKHLAQIKHISPQMYSFSRDKVKNFGVTAKKEEYELTLVPRAIRDTTGSPSNAMTPAIILSRQRAFYNLLLEKVKDHHSVFLSSLDPPLDIPKDKLNRWHPEFELEKIPDVEEDPLPEPPNVQKLSTAQDVLAHYREKFSCNTKMERALLKLAEAKKRGLTVEEQKATGLRADGTETTTQISSDKTTTTDISVTNSAPVTPINPALKGIPKALLEKVRARQAAKALESMMRTPAEEKNALTYQRLPDIARLLRNLFVTEKKSVLPLECILSKLDNSFRIKISNEDLVKHVRLLAKELPTWLTFYEFRRTEYLKMMKDADMSRIMSQLGDLATKHSL